MQKADKQKSALAITLIVLVFLSAASSQSVPRSRDVITVNSASSNLGVTLRVDEGVLDPGVALTALLDVKNLSDEDTTFPSEVRVTVVGETGEPETTLALRRMNRALRPGDTPIRDGDFEPLIVRGATFTRKYNLEDLYVLQPGTRYIVTFRVLDLLASRNNGGTWVQSNEVAFTAPSKK